MARPPFNYATPIGQARGGWVHITPEFKRFIDQIGRDATGDAADLSDLEQRVSLNEDKILALTAADVAIIATVQTNTNNIASLLVNVSQLQSDVTALQSTVLEQFEPVRVITSEF